MRIRAFGDVLRTRSGRWNTPRGRDETTPRADDDSYLWQALSTSHIRTRRRSVSEAADIYATADINWWKVRAGALTRRRTERFIEGSMNFERNIVNPSAR